MRKLRRVLIGLLGVGAIAALAAGTYADFNATVTNPGSSFATGTLVLSNGVGGTTCYSGGVAPTVGNGGAAISTANDSAAAGCQALFHATVKKPGQSASNSVTVKNEGSIAPTVYQLWAPGACASSAAAAERFHGSGDLCGKIQLTISDGTNCVYPAGAGACVADATHTLAHFSTTYTSAAPLSLTNIAGLGTNGTGGITYTFTWSLPQSADNSFQGLIATEDYTFFESQ